MKQKQIAATIAAALTAANASRRDRLADESDVRAAMITALKTGVGHRMAATVPAAYKYAAHRTAVAAVACGDLVAIYVGTISANSGSSPVTWFGVPSIRHVETWHSALTYDTWPLDRARIVITRRQALAWHRASMERAYGPLPTRAETLALRAARLAQVTV
jgi:hypothetical protein